MARRAAPDPTFFPDAAAFRRWLVKHHRTASELWIGFPKAGSGLPGMTRPEAVELSLCFGWIDGLVKRIDEQRFMQRYTPRKPDSIWSNINTRAARRLIERGLMQPAGLEAFQRRDEARTGIYTFEQGHGITLDPAYERELKANARAWRFFQAQPPWYRRSMTGWVMSAKREETRQRRLAQLIADSAAGQWIGPVRKLRDGAKQPTGEAPPVRKKRPRGSA
jgi:uncharacterized protein YdeI (YjbR/CyaY-like superfamily)